MANDYVRGLRPSRPESLGDFLDTELLKLQIAFEGVTAPVSGGGTSADNITATAGEALGGNRAVYIASDGKAYYADQSNTTARFVCGVTTAAVILGAPAAIRVQSVLTEPTWAWTTGDIVWLSTTGLLTQVIPTSNYLVQVGVPVGPTSLRIEPQLIAKI